MDTITSLFSTNLCLSSPNFCRYNFIAALQVLLILDSDNNRHFQSITWTLNPIPSKALDSLFCFLCSHAAVVYGRWKFVQGCKTVWYEIAQGFGLFYSRIRAYNYVPYWAKASLL